jgi:hypothetical protein
MKNLSLAFALILSVLFFPSCDPCQDGHVRAKLDQESYPVLGWTVETGSRFTPGIGTAIAYYTDSLTELNISGIDTIRVRFDASDNVSGIKMVDVEGGFGFTCSSDTSAIVFDGIYPSAPEEFALSSNCAPASHTFSTEFLITPGDFCSGANPNLLNGGWQLRGSAENHAGYTSQIVLTITWAP